MSGYKNLDLNELRSRVIKNQNADTTRPSDPSKTIVVTREGGIHLGDDSAKQAGPLTLVPQETFANRHEADRVTVSQFLPANTKPIKTDEGVNGYVYTFKTEFEDEFTLFAYFDGSNYQVQVVSPVIEDHFKSPHTGHLYSDGRICFGQAYGSGMPNLRDAFAKSVLWANGMSVAMRTGQFPFSNNN
jgi:hypothetical protein